MKKEQMKQFAEELRCFINKTGVADCEIEEIEDTTNCAIEVWPSKDNSTGAFHWATEVVDFCRGRNLSCWMGAAESDGRLLVYTHIF